VLRVVIQGSHQLRKLVSSIAILQNACGQGVLRVDNCTDPCKGDVVVLQY
jgi:hypothetical protein